MFLNLDTLNITERPFIKKPAVWQKSPQGVPTFPLHVSTPIPFTELTHFPSRPVSFRSVLFFPYKIKLPIMPFLAFFNATHFLDSSFFFPLQFGFLLSIGAFLSTSTESSFLFSPFEFPLFLPLI